MAASTEFSLILFFTCSLFLKGTLGEIVCEHLPTTVCSFAIASCGKRCLLETDDRETGYQCKTLEVVAKSRAPYIETDACVSACGLNRNSVGISSDKFLEPQFLAKLCSPNCYRNCPNIIDVYTKLADAEGVILLNLCAKQKIHLHRNMLERLSSGAAPGPIHAALGPMGANEIKLLSSGDASSPIASIKSVKLDQVDADAPADAPADADADADAL
ncbi:uncharacterized protein LOC130763937 [Actinidia eriantha]|uniref:uncharacterized protein LOC130763937 n=1 Tax=Actinidia eriantha TaxID=165200 RepID=UPI00258F736F|nr:uncharacterized protein LOC130763937 [Actinidia eriantha]